jgi:hypothetical protein
MHGLLNIGNEIDGIHINWVVSDIAMLKDSVTVTALNTPRDVHRVDLLSEQTDQALHAPTGHALRLSVLEVVNLIANWAARAWDL